jgi:thioredoxin-dependent peroxiredoxin
MVQTIYKYVKMKKGKYMKLNIGTKAPEFTAILDGGNTLSLSELKGKWVVLYFYPKDDTSGCTKEACEFRDNMERITALGAEVIGVSPDAVKSHDKFRDKYNLNFHLVSDTEKTICMDYGVWVEKSMYGKKYMGVERSTFILDSEGVIRHIFSKVKVDGHVDEVISTIIELKG